MIRHDSDSVCILVCVFNNTVLILMVFIVKFI